MDYDDIIDISWGYMGNNNRHPMKKGNDVLGK